jgi:site-specific DNA recombinase
MSRMLKNIGSVAPAFGVVCGIIPRPILYLLLHQPVALQALNSYRLALLWQGAVISGCLGLLGNGFSTVSAQSASGVQGEHRQLPLMPAQGGQGGGSRRRRGGAGHRPKPGGGNRAASYARYSSNLQREESIADQRRKCHELAAKNGHHIAPEHEFADEAVSGTKLRRDGLAALLKAAADGLFDVLYFHSLSRLARESVITMPMLKELVYVHRVRVISVTEGLDSDREGWDMIATFLAIQHERFIKDLSDEVFRGQEGNVLAGLSVGDYCFGYTSQPAPGSANRRGRNAKPQMVYVIDHEKTKWVVRIFHWFVVERRGLGWIARELNRLKAPKHHRATTPYWRHQMLPQLLRNSKYIGIWPWGERKNVRNPLTGQVSQEMRPPEETEKWVRHFPDLQIIDDATFELADKYLRENEDKFNQSRESDGRFNGSAPGVASAAPRHLLSGLMNCAECESVWYVGGSKAKYMYCTGHKAGVCTCRTKLRRDRAERLILKAIGRQIIADPAWHGAVVDFMRAVWRNRRQTLPSDLKAVQEALAEVERKITRLLDLAEESSKDPDILKRLADRRAERPPLVKEVERLKQATETATPEPTETWVGEQLHHLSIVLSGGGPAAAHALKDLVGGKIFVKQVERPGYKRHLLQGRFTIRLASVVAIATGGRLVPPPDGDASGDRQVEFVIDFVDEDPSDALADEVKRLYDEGFMCKEIAQEMNLWRSQVTQLLKHWCKRHGESLPDGRKRRATLPRKTIEVHPYERIADDAAALMLQGLCDAKIAKKLGCRDFVVTKAIRHWHRIRNLAVPTTKERRNARAKLAKQLVDSGRTFNSAAAELECSMPTFCKLMDLAYKLEGRERPDGRSQRASRGAIQPPDIVTKGEASAA